MILPAGYNPQQNVSAVIENTIKFIQLNWKPLLVAYCLICTLFFVPCYVFDLLYQMHYTPRTAQHHAYGFNIEWLKHTGIRFLLSMIGDTAFAATVLWFIKLYLQNGIAPSTKQVWDSFKLLYLNYYIVFAIIYIMVTFSFVLLVIPALFMMPFAGLMVTIMVFEGAGLSKAKDRTSVLIAGKWELIMGVFYSCLVAVLIPAGLMYVLHKATSPVAAPTETVQAIWLLVGYFFRCFVAVPFIGMAFYYLAVTAAPVIDELDAPTQP
jgi:hypothetical protein